MSRPVKYRCVESIPQITFFQPIGVPPGSLQEVILSIEEAEAIRLEGGNFEMAMSIYGIDRAAGRGNAGSALGGKRPKDRRNSNACSSHEHTLSL